MKNLCYTLALLAITVISGCGGSSDSSPDSLEASAKAAIDSNHKAFLAAMMSNDADALAALVTSDAVFMPPNDSSRLGQEGVRSWYKGIVAQFKITTINITDREVIVAGDWGIERLNFAWTLTPVAGGAETTDKGRVIAIWHKEPDGTWKIRNDIWNSSIPPPQ